jgi:hypothetical protein
MGIIMVIAVMLLFLVYSMMQRKKKVEVVSKLE